MSFALDFERVIDYIEENLSGEIDLVTVSRLARCSIYHFQRVFSFVAEVPLSEYIRRRRMTLAAFELQNTAVKVIDVALKYGYDSHSSFTRSFQTIQGMTPSEARTKGAVLTAYPKLSLQFNLKGVKNMQYRFKNTKPFKLFGLNPIKLDSWRPEAFIEYGDTVIEDGTHDRINRAAGFSGEALSMIEADAWDVSRLHLLHLVHFFDEAGRKYAMYGWDCPEGGVGDEFTVLDIPASAWVVVTAELDGERGSILKSYEDLYMKWFPTSGYNQAKGLPIIEKYDERTCQLWMPLEKKNS